MNATSVLLEPLSDAQSESLISNLLGATDLAEDIRARIVQAAEGNPLFVEQMLAMLIDDGLVHSVDGHWVRTSDRLAVTVPPTIAALLSARLDRLDADERDVIGRASVVGKVFYRGALVELSSEPVGVRVDALLQGLVRKDLIRPDRSTLRERTPSDSATSSSRSRPTVPCPRICARPSTSDAPTGSNGRRATTPRSRGRSSATTWSRPIATP